MNAECIHYNPDGAEVDSDNYTVNGESFYELTAWLNDRDEERLTAR